MQEARELREFASDNDLLASTLIYICVHVMCMPGHFYNSRV
jgi:hypothetical protein